MLIPLAVVPLALAILAAAYRRRRARVTVARLAPGQLAMYSTIARTRRW